MKNKTCNTSGLSAEDFTSASAYPIAGGMWGRGGGGERAERDRDDGVTGKEVSALSLCDVSAHL